MRIDGYKVFIDAKGRIGLTDYDLYSIVTIHWKDNYYICFRDPITVLVVNKYNELDQWSNSRHKWIRASGYDLDIKFFLEKSIELDYAYVENLASTVILTYDYSESPKVPYIVCPPELYRDLVQFLEDEGYLPKNLEESPAM